MRRVLYILFIICCLTGLSEAYYSFCGWSEPGIYTNDTGTVVYFVTRVQTDVNNIVHKWFIVCGPFPDENGPDYYHSLCTPMHLACWSTEWIVDGDVCTDLVNNPGDEQDEEVLRWSCEVGRLVEEGTMLDVLNDAEAGQDLEELATDLIESVLADLSKYPLAGSESDINILTGGDPVSLTTGEYSYSTTDVFIPGKGPSIGIKRTYAGRREYNSCFGYGWDMNYNMKVRPLQSFDDPGTVEVDESEYVFDIILLDGMANRRKYSRSTLDTDNFTRDTDRRMYLRSNAEPTNYPFTLVKKEGLLYHFDANGNLSIIENSNGDTVNLTYDTVVSDIYGPSKYFIPPQEYGLAAMEYRLTEVQDTLGNTVSFTYDSNSGLLETISHYDPVMTLLRSWDYSYDPETNDLTSVSGPEVGDPAWRPVTTYKYDYNHKLTDIYDPENYPASQDDTSYIEHAYDFDNQVKSQRYGEPEAGSESYEDSTYGFVYNHENQRVIVKSREKKAEDINKSYTVSVYNDAGQTLSETIVTSDLAASPTAFVTEYEYSQNSEVIRAVLPRRNCVDYEYDDRGNLITATSRPESDVLPFDGTQDYISVADSSDDFAFGATDDDFAIAFWLKRQRLDQLEYLLDRRDSSGYGWNLVFKADNTLELSIADDIDTVTATSTSTITDSKWHYVVITFDRDVAGGDASIYVDGGLAEGTITAGGPEITSSAIELNIGCSYNGVDTRGDFFYGSLDELMILSKALPAREDTFGLSIYSQALVGCWKMDDNDSTTTIVDSGTLGKDGTSARNTDLMVDDGKVQGSIETSFTYTTDSRDFEYLTSATDAKGNVTTCTYDFVDPGLGWLMEIEYPEVLAAQWYEGSIITSMQTPTVQFTYYDVPLDELSYGQIKTITAPDGLVTEYEYYDNTADPENQGRLKYVTIDPEGESIVTEYSYDEYGHVEVLTQDAGTGGMDISTQFTYDALDQLIKTTHPQIGTDPSLETHFDYNENGKLWKTRRDFTDGQSNPQTQTIEYAYNLLDALKKVTDSLSNKMVKRYDDNENLTELIDAEGMGSYQEDPYVPPDYQTEYEYDERNLLQTVTDAESADTTYTYDRNGNVLSITDAKSQVTTYEYNNFDRLVKVTYPLDSASNNTTVEFGYDSGSNVVCKKTRADDYIYYDYGAMNRLTRKIIDSSGGVDVAIEDNADSATDWTLETSAAGKYGADYLESIVQDAVYEFQAAVSTSEEYVIYLRWPETAIATSVTVKVHDDVQLGSDIIINQTQNPGQWNGIGSFTFDTTGTATIQIVSQGTLITCADTVRLVPSSLVVTEYLYDIAGRVLQVDDDGDITAYHYDVVGRVTQVDDQQSRSVSYGYDKLSRRTVLTYPGSDGFVINYVYDEMSRLTDITDDTKPTPNLYAHYDYDELSRRTTVTYGNGAVISYDYEDQVDLDEDNLSNRLEQVDNDINGSDYITFDYTYDKVGNRVEMVTDSDTFTYGYDNIYQLTDYDFTSNSFDFFYDALGNRDYINLNDLLDTDYTITDNELNQYTTVDSASFSYDNNGNLTDDGVSVYTYDGQNRFVSAVTPSHNCSYEYDHLGRRIARTVDGTTTHYCYDGDQVIAEYDNSGGVLRRFIYGPGIDEPIIMIDDPLGTAVWYYYHYDGLGSVIALSNISGTVVEKYAYDAFGKTTVILDGGTENPYRFTGRRWDDETTLYYYRARMYSPTLGRFLQTDPIGYYDGMNMYTYCGNNPQTFVDPFGLCKDDRGFWQKLWDGDYFGTQFGASSTDIWAARAVASETWYGTAGNYFMGGLSALWTPETYKETAMVLASGYGASRGLATQGARQTARQAGNLSDDVARTFRGGNYRTRVLQNDVTAYRYSGGVSRARGQYLTTRQTVQQIGNSSQRAQNLLNLPSGATAETLNVFTIPQGTTVSVGRVAGGGARATQVFIENSALLIPVP